MRFKQKTALLLASVMLVGSVGIMNPTEVRAVDATNTFTLTVPSDTSITKSGWNDIGNIEVSKVSIASEKKISVTIENGATGRTLKKTGDASKTVGYVIKKGNAATNEEFGTSLDFTANGTQAIGADVEDFSKAVAGTYEDNITFKAELANKVVTYTKAGGGTLSSADLGEPAEWEYSSTTYQVYNAFIPLSIRSSWNDATGFVKELNIANYDGHSDWTLLSSKEMATAWYNKYGKGGEAVNRGGVKLLWSSADGNILDCESGQWGSGPKSFAGPTYGFVVLRGSSNAPASTAVTYPRAGKEALSSEDLGIPTEWKYNDTTYQVYNAFIPSSSGSSWNDAVGFVAALNDAKYGGYSDWQLFDGTSSSSPMATAWYNQYIKGDSAVDRGGVNFLWSTVGVDENNAYYLSCNDGGWIENSKSYAETYFGFVVLRGSESSESTGVEYTLTGKNAGGKKLTSADLLASKTADASTYSTFTYDSTTYTAYNGYVSETTGANWTDAKNFVEELNKVELDGRNGGWTLLTDRDMAYNWWLSTDSVEKKGAYHVGGNYKMWSSASNEVKGYYWDCYQARITADSDGGEYSVKNLAWNSDNKSLSLDNIGFVVLRESSSDSGEDPEEVTMKNASSNTLSSADLGAPSVAFSVGEGQDEKWYVAYNGFISSTSGSNWQDAQEFVEALKSENYGGHTDWTLLSSKEMATAWYNKYGTGKEKVDCGEVDSLWSSVDDPDGTGAAYYLNCKRGVWDTLITSNVNSRCGFVVLRGSVAPTETEPPV